MWKPRRTSSRVPDHASSSADRRAARPDAERVVVTGWGMVSPLGNTVEATFAAMRAGQSGIGPVTRFDAKGLFCDIGGEVDTDAFWPLDARGEMGGSAYRLARRAMDEALTGGLLDDIEDRARMGVVLGGHGHTPSVREIAEMVPCLDEAGSAQPTALAALEDYDTTALTRRQPDVVAALLALEAGARGPIAAIVSACAAGTQAIGEGLRLIRDGVCDVVITGGAEPVLSYSGYLGFSILGALTRRYPSPEKASRPFDRRRNGFVIAEGAGVLVLESLAHAQARGKTPLGEVLGYGDSADAYLITAMHPKGEGALQAMQRAVDDAGLEPDHIDYVNAHGTSTPINDPTETMALKRLLGERAHDVPMSSNKSMLGHTIGAAGAIEAILTLRGMQAGILLPTINQEAADPKCDLDYVPNEAREMAHDVALSNSFGFGGQNGCLCLGSAP